MLAKIVQASPIGIAALDAKGIVTCANAAFCRLFGFADAEAAAGSDLGERLGTRNPTARADLAAALASPEEALIATRPGRGVESLTLRLAAAGIGPRILVACRQTAADGDAPASTRLSNLDPLTGLGNRTMLEETIANWQPGGAETPALAVIMIDLDRFKTVNDTLGHGAGDTLLKLVAKRIKSATRNNDVVIRMGGDEFVVVNTIGLQPIGAESVAKRVVDLVGRPFLIDGQQVNIGASVGLAALDHGTYDKDDLLKHADLALYEAKAAGRGTVKFFQPELAQRALQRRQLEIDLRRALGLKEFTLAYQPQVDMTGRALQGFEALIRWQSPTRGLVSPADFVPLAEEIGEMHAIGEWVLHAACKEARSWDGDYTVAVNVSPIQFEDARIVDIVRDALANSGLAPARLEIEITEGLLMRNFSSAVAYLREIRALGVGIAMDDFGTGYSSLSLLSSLPFTKIKIDQSFVRGEQSDKSRALVQAIIALGTSLNMTTVAEGVETAAQFDQLAAGGCTQAQGYLISRPIPAAGIAGFVSAFKQSTESTGASK